MIILKGSDALSKYSIHEFSKIIGVSAKRCESGILTENHPHHTTTSGYRLF